MYNSGLASTHLLLSCLCKCFSVRTQIVRESMRSINFKHTISNENLIIGENRVHFKQQSIVDNSLRILRYSQARTELAKL